LEKIADFKKCGEDFCTIEELCTLRRGEGVLLVF
jgi:hypothetical protein